MELEKIHPVNIEPLGIIEKYQNQQAEKLVRFPAFSRFFDNTQRFNQSGTYFIAFSSDFCAVRSKKKSIKFRKPKNLRFFDGDKKSMIFGISKFYGFFFDQSVQKSLENTMKYVPEGLNLWVLVKNHQIGERKVGLGFHHFIEF